MDGLDFRYTASVSIIETEQKQILAVNQTKSSKDNNQLNDYVILTVEKFACLITLAA
jgi:hypothetical protein